MIHIVMKGKTLLRAFSSYDDATKYKEVKLNIMHNHCCVFILSQ